MNKGTDADWPASGPGIKAESPGSAASNDPRAEGAAATAPRERSPDIAGSRPKGEADRAGKQRKRRGRRRQNRRSSREFGPYYAALDLGTNNCRLLIAEPRGQSFFVVDSYSRIVRLGEGLSHSGKLSDDAMSRALDALRICRDKIARRDVARHRLIATEACRSAANGDEFLARVRNEVGMQLEVIDRRTEAKLAAAGCTSLLDSQADGAILFDIGGGSSEIVWLDRKNKGRRGLVKAWVSLPIGVVTLAERHGGVDVTDADFETMVGDVRDEFHRFRARDSLRQAIEQRPFHFLGTSGTVTTLAGVHLGLKRYNRRFVDGLWMHRSEIAAMMDRICAMDYDDRVANPCIGKERADLVLAGCAIFEAIRREWPLDRLRVADRGLREGILVNLMRADGHLSQAQPPRANQKNN